MTISQTADDVLLKFNTLKRAEIFVKANKISVVIDKDRIPGKFLVCLPIFENFYENFRTANKALNLPALSDIPFEITQYSPPKSEAEKINAQRERGKPKKQPQNNQQNNNTNEDKNEICRIS